MGKTVRKATTALWPMPVVLVTCGVETPNIITLAWVGTVCSRPPMVGIAVRPSRHSHGLIRQEGQFIVNLPTAEMLDAVDICGTVSGRDRDKFSLCDLTPEPASAVQVPMIAQCPVNLECVVRQTVPLGSHDLFLGEIVAVQVDEAIVDHRMRVDYEQADLLLYVEGNYHALGQALAGYGFSRGRE